MTIKVELTKLVVAAQICHKTPSLTDIMIAPVQFQKQMNWLYIDTVCHVIS